jgi:hypothetical protein
MLKKVRVGITPQTGGIQTKALQQSETGEPQ